MKNVNHSIFKAIAVLFAVGLIAFGCAPQSDVAPKGDGPAVAALGDTVHTTPDTICGQTLTGDIVDAMGNSGSGNIFGADTYGSWEIIATPQQMFLQVSLGRGWFVKHAYCWMGASANIPRMNDGNVDAENLPINNIVDPVKNLYEVMWPIGPSMQCPNTSWVYAQFILVELDFLGLPFNDTPVWCGGTATGTNGAQWFQYCAVPCGSAVPPCAVPTPGPGDDLSDYECGNGNNTKVTVCHVPPGNPANMHEICISENALPAHILEFKPASNPCMGHHSGCHIGPCDPCGPGSTGDFIADYVDPCPGNGGNGGNNGGGNGNGNGRR